MRRVLFFLRLFSWFSLRHMRAHKGRALAVLLGIALGAAVFTSVRLSIHASLDAFTRSINLISGKADSVVVNPGGQVPEKQVAELLRHPAVKAASPVLQAFVQTDDESGDPFLLIGLDPLLDYSFRNWQTVKAEETSDNSRVDLIRKPFTLAAAEKLAEELGLKKGDEISLHHAGQKAEFRVSGILDSEGLALADGGRIAVTDIATFQEFTCLFGQVDRIDLLLQPGGSNDITGSPFDAVRKILPGGIRLERSGRVRESGQNLIRAYQLNLSVLSFVSLFVGMFLIYSLVALNAAARRRELAILRAVGTSGRMVFLLFLSEGAFLGLLGWLCAFPAGSLLVRYMIKGVSQTVSTLFVRVHVDQLNLSGGEILISFSITLLVSVLAALEPACEAMGVSPKEALSPDRPQTSLKNTARRLALLGLACIAAVWPLAAMPGLRGVPLPGYVAVFALFAGFSLLSPFFLRLTGIRLSPILRKTAGEPAYLAGRYLRDSGTRVAVSVGSLITAVALFTALVIMIHSFRGTVELWVNQTVSGDLFVTPRLAEFNRHRSVFPKEFIRIFKKVDAADRVPFRRYYLHCCGIPYQFEAIAFDSFRRHGRFIQMTDAAGIDWALLSKGEGIIVSEVFSNRTGLGPGDRFQDRIDGIRVDVPIVGIIRDYRSKGGMAFFSLSRFEALQRASGRSDYQDRWSGVRFFFRPDTPDVDRAVSDLRSALAAQCGERISMISGKKLRQNILKVFDDTFAVTTVLLLIALLVAALGIATTLTVLVLERSRQLNTLFAVGGSRGQIRTMIFWEAALMVVMGEAVGLICGFILSFILIFVINRQSFGWTFIYSVDWRSLSLSLPLIFAAALTAAVPAVRFVFRKPPATLLREE